MRFARALPALKVSIPFIAGQWSLRLGYWSWLLRQAGFNPLHCGAVVASNSYLRSIIRYRFSFNPLHCGAVVASKTASARRRVRSARVSIPFIAGQWSLQVPAPPRPPKADGGFNPLHCGAVVASQASPNYRGDCKSLFQSPSLRGSGRFLLLDALETALSGFNPLHCGAVVASPSCSASLRGWATGFNPLHCGAVVASERCEAYRRVDEHSFNPLHCGAVVASRPLPRADARAARIVSIPFIAGQWSLPVGLDWSRFDATVFQSPSLRGSGRFVEAARTAAPASDGFNPLHCGAVVASNNNNRVPAAPRRAFQSPSLRGSGRFNLIAPRRMAEGQGFQSPSLRGSGRFDAAFAPFGAAAEAFQSPSLRGSGRFPTGTCSVGRRSWGFNPLHCGAVVASS